ncbi:MAG: hypothetical protein Q9188_002767 [Gyalolechia gomerana]
MKSLDNLIRHLLEEVALCGDYGAGPSDFVNYVNGYYAGIKDSNDGTRGISSNATAVDRKFLEKVWGWLTRHPEIEVGEDGWANNLSLSEAERQSASAEAQHHEVLDHAVPTPEPGKDRSTDPSPAREATQESGHALPNVHGTTPSSKASGHLRIYASLERRWQAIAGHAPDPIKIPRLDFACLSIIAVHGEKGILQPDLVRISQQDKRSVPERTRRLHDGGYISKVPVLINRSHTSKLTLKRYVKSSIHRSGTAGAVDDAGQILRPAKNSTENEIDFLALQHKIFDILKEFRLITFNELKEKLVGGPVAIMAVCKLTLLQGITGLRWPMRLLATNLRRLEFLGCIKQVRAHPVTESTVPFLFRCVKYIRDPEGKEWEPMQFPSRKHFKQSNVDDGPNALSDDDQEYEAEEAFYLARRGGDQQLPGLKEIERPIPQWPGDGTLSNLLYDLVHASGRDGMSTMVLRRDCPLLVEMWQMSQPLHLRHLAVIRDAALTAGIPHYVHYSFENFKRLVDEGKASWDSVMTVTKDHKDFKTIAAIEAEPELDENGFPKLSSTFFQGRYNDAGLVECVKGLPSNKLAPPIESQSLLEASSAKISPKKFPRSQGKRRPKVQNEPNLVVTEAGRERKVPREGLPAEFENLSAKEQRYILWCQEAARKYKKLKLTKEIERRMGEGGDRYENTAAVLNLAIDQYRGAGKEPPWELMEEIRNAALIPSLVALEATKKPSTLNVAIRTHEDILQVMNFKPSAAAHCRALQKPELLIVENMLEPKIRFLETIPISGNVKKTKFDILLEAARSEENTKVDVPKRKQRQGSSKRAARPKQKPIAAVGSGPNSSIPPAPRQPSLGKRKYHRKKKGEPYLPSVAAHTWSTFTTEATSGEMAFPKRKRKAVEPKVNKRQKRVSWKKAQLEHDADVDASPCASRPSQRLEVQTYDQQLQNISPTAAGCYLGKVVNLLQAGKRGVKRKSRLAVFKSARIQGLACFTAQTEMNEVEPQVRNQNQTKENRRDQLTENTREDANTSSSSVVIPQKGDSIARTILQNTPLPVSAFHNQQPRQPQDGGPLNQECPAISYRNDPAPMILNPTDPTQQPTAYAPDVIENSTGTNRKRSINDDARSEIYHAPPAPMSIDGSMAMFPHCTPTASGLESSSAENQPSTLISDLHIALVQEDPHLSPLPGAFENQKEQHPVTEEASGGSSMPDHQGSPPEIGTEHICVNDLGAGFSARGLITSPDSDQLGFVNPGRNDQGTQCSQQNPNSNITLQRSTGEVPSTSYFDASHSRPLDPIEVGNEGSRDVLTQNALSRRDATDDTVIAQSNRMSEGLEPATSGIAPGADNFGELATHSSESLPRDPDHAASPNQVPQVTVIASFKPEAKTGIRKMRPQGGSVAAQRRKIVMDIMGRCGGIYPGIAELSAPFKEQWTKSGYPGKAETKTLNAVIKSLCESGKLRQLKFCFKDRRGLIVTKSMITDVEVSPTDPRVSEMQKTIIGKHPAWYIPGETGVSDEVRNTIWNPKGPMKNRTMKDLDVEQEKVQLQQKPGYLERYELQEKSRQERKAEEERKTAALLTWMAEGRLPDDEDILDRSMFGPLNTAYARNRFLSFARRTVLKDPQGKVERLASIKSGRAGRVVGSSRQKPLPTGHQTFQKRSQATIRDEASRRLEEMRKTRSLRLGNKLTFTHLLTADDFEAGWKAQMLEEKLHELAIERVSAANAAEGIAYNPDVPPTHSFGGQPALAEHTSAPSEASQNLIFRLSKNGLSIVPDSDPELAEFRNAGDGKSLDPMSHSWAARQQMYTIMEPEHAFHPATGTFSVNFSAFRTPHQIMQKYHWQRPIAKGFHDHVDDSERFELAAKGFEDAKFGDWPFINYTFPHSHKLLVDQKRKKQGLIYLNHGDRHDPQKVLNKVSKQTPAQSQKSSVTSFQTARTRESPPSSTSTAPSPGPSSQLSVTPAKRKKSVAYEPYKTRRLTTLDQSSLSFKPRLAEDPLQEPGADARHRRGITGRRLYKLGSDFTRRLLTAVIVIRTLTGGVERNIDWVLVTKLFQPDWNQADIQKTWPQVLQSHKVQAEMIQVQFQPMFLKAYEKGLVPALDYDQLQEYDWSWLIDWTVEHLDTPIDGVLDLPSRRSNLEEVFDISAGRDDTSMSVFYEFDVGRCSVRRRESELHKRAWVSSLTIEALKASEAVVDDVAIAKTWIRANIATKEEAYRPDFARDKIDRRFPVGVVDQAIKGLLGERVIVHLNKGRLQPKRNFDLNQQYVRRLNKNVEVSQFYRAPMFKRQVDNALANGGEMVVPQTADEAFRLAMQNMQAHRRISLVAKNPPMEKFGVGGVGNYKSRQIPMEKYYFDVGMRATGIYVEGNPLLPLPKPPLSSLREADKEKIPLWYDINGDVIEDLWMTAIAAVMAVLVMRPGVSIHEVEPTVRPTLGLWEVQMLLEWMVEARAARKIGERYMAEEWWWLCLDSGKTVEEDKVESGKSRETGEGNAEDHVEDQRGSEGDVHMEDV